MTQVILCFMLPLSLSIIGLLLTTPGYSTVTIENRSVDLHVHLFMKEGVGPLIQGHFHEPIQARDWSDRFRSKANQRSLLESGNAITILALYAHPLFTLSLRESIGRQIQMAEEFVVKNPRWVIAREPEEAERVIAEGKSALILSLEGASGILESERDLREFIDRRGIRIVTPMHFIDDEFGGASFMHGALAIYTPFAWFRSLFLPVKSDGIKINARGLTEKGRWLAKELTRRGVWIDLSHASDRTQEDIIAIQNDRPLPLLHTHTVLRKYLRAERGISQQQIEEIRLRGGIVGLIPAENLLIGTPTPEAPCAGGFPALAIQYREIASQIRPDSVVIGSDFNAPLAHLRADCKTGTLLDQQGLKSMGLTPEVWKALRESGSPVPASLNQTVGRFIELWKQIR